MSFSKIFNESILPSSRKLDELMGIKHIEVRQLDKPMTMKFVRAKNPMNETVYVTESEMRKCEELGLSMRRF